MDTGGRTWAWIAAAAVIGALLGAALAWSIASGRISALEEQRDDLEARATETSAIAQLADERASEIASLTARIDTMLQEADEVAPPKTPSSDSPGKPVRQFAFLSSIVVGHPTVLAADYARFLTGEEAIEAAREAGDESPPPNDFYIVNESTRLRRLPVARDATVMLVSTPGQGTGSAYESDLATLAGYLARDSEDTISVRTNGYWLTIENGYVTSIEEQYLP